MWHSPEHLAASKTYPEKLGRRVKANQMIISKLYDKRFQTEAAANTKSKWKKGTVYLSLLPLKRHFVPASVFSDF